MVDTETGRPSFIRAHPFISVWIALTVTPLLIGAGLLAIRYMPPCADWRREVRESAEETMKARYIGFGNRRAVDAAYQSEGMGYADIMDSLLNTAEHELADSRPFACI